MSNESTRAERLRIAGLARLMEQTAQVEAAELNARERELTLATVGKITVGELREQLQQSLVDIQREFGNRRVPALSSDAWIQVSQEQGNVRLEKPSCPTAPTIWQWREIPWPEVADHEEESGEEWRKMALQTAVCAACGLIGFGFSFVVHAPSWISLVFYVSAMVAGGWDAAQDAWQKLKRRKLDIHFLMIAVAVGAASIGAWAEGVLLLFLFTLSGALEHFAFYRTQREMGSLFRLAPKTAVILDRDGEETTLAVERICPGQRIRVRPGDLFPVDACIQRGKTSADESTLTGESTPVNKAPGDEVYSGTLNLWGSVDAEVLRPASSSALQKIIDLIQQAQHLKAPTQRFADKFGTGYTWIILTATTAMFFVWWLVLGVAPFANRDESYSAFYRAMTLLVVASPCALVLSIPSAILAAIAWGARHGVLFRGGAAVEKLANVDFVALDKTGTLTTGDLQVAGVESYPSGEEDEVLRIAYALERHSAHPIARAIVGEGNRRGLTAEDVDEFEALSGKGIRGVRRGAQCVLGRRELVAAGPLAEIIANASQPGFGITEVWVVHEQLLGRILLKDRIRTESKQVIERLHKMGIGMVMLTGDRSEVAIAVARTIGLRVDDVRAGLLPEEKVSVVAQLTKAGNKVAMVGDGVNDAPSLAAAYVSVAMGARGSDAALEQSEVILMNDRIELFLSALRLSRAARRGIWQNLAVSLGTVIVMVGVALFGVVPLTVGVIAHEGSTVLVVMNSLRLLFLKDSPGVD